MTTSLTAEEPSSIYKVLLGQHPRSQPTRLGDVLTVIRGVTYKKEQARQAAADGLVPLLRATNIQQSLTFDDLVFVPASCVSEAQRLRAGDIVVAASSGSRNIVGKAAPLKRAWSGSFGAFCFALRPKTSVNPEYLAWFMRSPQYRERVSLLAAGVNINNLRASHIEETVFPLPPVGEQREIVAHLDEQLSRLDASVAALLRAQANLKRYRASVLKAACEGRLVPTEAELARAEGRAFESGAELLKRVGTSTGASAPETNGPLTLPEEWGLASVDMVGDVLLGRQRAPQYLTGDSTCGYLRVANIKDDRIDFDDLNSMDFDATHFAKYRLESGDILVSEGQSPELLGQSAIFRGHTTPLCFQKTLHRFRAHPGLVTIEYAQLVFRSHLYGGVFRKFGSITTNIGHLTLNRFKAVWFPLPPLAEQNRIVAEADRRLSLIRAAEAQVAANLARAKRLRQSILQAAFSQGAEAAAPA